MVIFFQKYKYHLFLALSILLLALTILYACKPPDIPSTARRLMEEHLNSYKSEAIDVSERLSDFRIDQVELLKSDGQTFLLGISFSVKQTSTDQDNQIWMASDGVLAEGGWIIHKYTEVVLTKSGNGYVIKIIGRG